MARLARKLARDAARVGGTAAAGNGKPHELIAVVRRTRDGFLAVIEVVGMDVVTDTVKGATLEDTLRAAVDVMVADVGDVVTAKVLISGRAGAA